MTPEEKRARDREYSRRYREKHPEYVERQRIANRARARKYYERNKELVNARVKARRKADPAGTYAYNRIVTCRKYGMTVEGYERMYQEQDGKCAVCAEPFEVLCIDHNHSTGAVRQLLCASCNTAIGLFEHPLRSQWEAYLERHGT